MIVLGWLAFVLLTTGVIGYVMTEKHRSALKIREENVSHIILLSEKRLPEGYPLGSPKLVTGSTVMSCGQFTQWLASFRLFFGGEIRSFEDMVELGRRESIVRMKEEANLLGAKMVINVRIQTATLSEAKQNTMLELLCYGTAIIND